MVMAPLCLAHAASESMINPTTPAWRGKSRGKIFAPGVRIVLPDGRRGIIERLLPDGQLLTDLGVTLNPDGTLVEDPATEAVILEVPEEAPENVEAAPVKIPEAAEAPEAEPEKAREHAAIPEKPAETPENAVSPEKQLILAEMIPLTAPETAKKPAPDKKAPLEPKKAEAKQPEKKAQPESKKAETKQPEKKAPAPAKKAKTGEELRIPEEAVKTGNLDFLEGCWQGTRPEYYSKRTIRECFCFGANGKAGKRRVFDPVGHRSCIGATSASLSKNGVLSVTSQGAACDDGERWGQAEMVCRNSGPKTPCSWVFRDANNGRQSYTIPFVKVESCGR